MQNMRKRKGGRPVVGLILIALGALFLLDTLDVLSNNILGTYWPVLAQKSQFFIAKN